MLKSILSATLLISVVVALPSNIARSNIIKVTSDGYKTLLGDMPYIQSEIQVDGETINLLQHPSFVAVEDAPGSSPNPARRAIFDSSQNPDQCGPAEFYNKSSSGSPWWGDCQKVVASASVRRGSYNIYPSEVYEGKNRLGTRWIPITASDSCQFGVKVRNGEGAKIGSDDIRDLVSDSLTKFHEAKVGAEGKVLCNTAQPDDRQAWIEWAIFHT